MGESSRFGCGEGDGRKASSSTHFLAGSLSGLASGLLLQPLDVVKTRLIVSLNAAGGHGAVHAASGSLQAGRTIAQTEGIAALWKGWSPTAVRISMGAGVYFSSLSILLPRDRGDSKSSSLASIPRTLAAGAASRAIATTLLCPFSVVKTRFEAMVANERSSVVGTLAKIQKNEGIRGLYKGLSATLIRDMPFSGIHVTLYMQLLPVISQSTPDSSIAQFVAAALAGGAATMVTHPVDVIRTNQQLSKGHIPIISALNQLWVHHGLAGVFRGAAPRVVKRGLSNAIIWMIYEQTLKLCRNETPHSQIS